MTALPTDPAPTDALAAILEGGWQDDGACRHPAGDLDWFPPPSKPARAAAAVAVCEACPVQTECLLFALHFAITDGIWGGMSAKKRAKFRTMLDRLGLSLALPLHRCARCGKQFRTSILTSNAKYCSPACRSVARRRLRRALEASR